jgi:hypothetical protein
MAERTAGDGELTRGHDPRRCRCALRKSLHRKSATAPPATESVRPRVTTRGSRVSPRCPTDRCRPQLDLHCSLSPPRRFESAICPSRVACPIHQGYHRPLRYASRPPLQSIAAATPQIAATPPHKPQPASRAWLARITRAHNRPLPSASRTSLPSGDATPLRNPRPLLSANCELPSTRLAPSESSWTLRTEGPGPEIAEENSTEIAQCSTLLPASVPVALSRGAGAYSLCTSVEVSTN